MRKQAYHMVAIFHSRKCFFGGGVEIVREAKCYKRNPGLLQFPVMSYGQSTISSPQTFVMMVIRVGDARVCSKNKGLISQILNRGKTFPLE